MRAERFPLGAGVTVGALEGDPHDLLARLQDARAGVVAAGGRRLARDPPRPRARRDARRGDFTVDDPRFTTAQVVGRSMLSLDGAEHDRHRAPFVAPLRLGEVRRRLADAVAGGDDAAGRRARAARRGRAAARLRGAAGGRGGHARAGARRRDGRRRCSAGTTRSWPRSPTSARAGRRGRRRRARSRSSARRCELDAAGLTDAEVSLERRRAAVRRHRDDRGDDRQRACCTCSRTRRRWPRCAPIRRCCPPRSRSRCGSSPPRR